MDNKVFAEEDRVEEDRRRESLMENNRDDSETSSTFDAGNPLPYESSRLEIPKSRGRLKLAATVVRSFLLFAFGLVALQGRTLASSMFGDPFFAVAFSIIPVIVGFPILVGGGFLIRFIAERVLKRPLPGRRSAPWLVPAVVGLACLVGSFLFDRSPQKLFHQFLNTDPPPSLSNLSYWWDTLPGDSLYVFRFDLDPADFDKLLANHQFVEDSNPADIQKAMQEDVVESNIQMPQSPLVTMYKYSSENPPGLPHIIEIFTTQDRRQVIISGDN